MVDTAGWSSAQSGCRFGMLCHIHWACNLSGHAEKPFWCVVHSYFWKLWGKLLLLKTFPHLCLCSLGSSRKLPPRWGAIKLVPCCIAELAGCLAKWWASGTKGLRRFVCLFWTAVAALGSRSGFSSLKLHAWATGMRQATTDGHGKVGYAISDEVSKLQPDGFHWTPQGSWAWSFWQRAASEVKHLGHQANQCSCVS